MTRLLGRLFGAVPVLFGVVVLAFVLVRVLPGDPAAVLAAHPGMTAADVAEVRAATGLDRPLGEQFLRYVAGLARGDMGLSLSTGRPVAQEVMARLPASLELALAGFVLALGLAVPLGVAAAVWPGSVADRGVRAVAAVGGALPTFVTGLLAIHLFYFRLGLAPEPVGRFDPFLPLPARMTGFLVLDAVIAGEGAAARAALARLVLPGLVMALFAFAPLVRITRAAMLAALAGDPVRGARALGLSPARVLWGYAFRQALGPVVTLAGLVFCAMLGANVLVEHVFAWPGVGAFALEALVALDFAAVQGVLLVLAGACVLVNLLVDLVQVALDPRAAADG